jgi:hypothetical protein
MNIFFDTEFTGLHKNTTLISIGLISDNNKMFYAEFSDYDRTQVDEWIQKNVIDNLTLEKEISVGWHEVSDNLTLVRGNRFVVREALNDWLKQFDTIEWISDVCHYDFVLLIDLICGHALKLPYGKWNSACHDINQDIAKTQYIDEIKAFDYSREEILKEHDIQIDGEKHNSLYDAKVIKVIYDIVK